MKSPPRLRRNIWLAGVALGALSLVATACGSTATNSSNSTNSSSSNGSIVDGGTLVAATNGSGPWSPVFNPFSPSYNYAFGFGAVYEPLYMADPKSQTDTPWLATSYRWSDGGNVLAFKIRTGVKWSNGKPLTPSDVAFTFDLEKKITTESGGTNELLSATVSGDWVTLRYNASQYVNFDSIAMNIPIVPPFTFSSATNPLKFEDSHPIGTGPFELVSENSQYITYKKNPNYWQKGKPYIDEVQDVAADSNSTMEALLIAHRISYSGVFTADIFKTFVDRNPSANIVYTPPDGTISLALNLSDAVFQNVALRKAINVAVDRTSLDKIGESGAEPPASQSGLSGSATTPYILSQYSAPLAKDVTKARSLLTAGGYKLSSGKLTAAGSTTQVGFSLLFPSSYSDWMTDCSIIEQNLSAIGIAVNCDGVSYQTWSADESTGQFQATFDTAVGPTPYQEYNEVFSVGPSGLPAIGQSNDYVNLERYVNPQAEAVLKQLQTINPANTSAQKAAVSVLEKIMVNDVPVIPLFESTYHEDFVNGPLYGWPSSSNNYMCTYCNAYQEQILLNVHKK